MDYRNADGSVSEMCGNGIRVFALHLVQEGLVDPAEPIVIGTRGGDKTITIDGDLFSVDMGTPEVLRRLQGQRRREHLGGAGGSNRQPPRRRLRRPAGRRRQPADAARLRRVGLSRRRQHRVRRPRGRAPRRDACARARFGGDAFLRHRRLRRGRGHCGGRRGSSTHAPTGSTFPAARCTSAGTPTTTSCSPAPPRSSRGAPWIGLHDRTDVRPTPKAPKASSSRSATRCGASPACAPSSRTSPRSSTASSGWSASSSSAYGPRAPPRTPRTRSPSSSCSPRPPAPRCSTP